LLICLGVDATRIPRNFSTMDPRATIDIQMARFLGENISPASSTTASSPEPYTNVRLYAVYRNKLRANKNPQDGAVEYLSPGDPIAGVGKLTEWIHRVSKKRQIRDLILNTNTSIMNGAEAEKWELDQEVDWMQEKLEAKRARDAAGAAKKERKSGPPKPSAPTQATRTLKRKFKSYTLSNYRASQDDMDRIQSQPESLSSTASKQRLLSESTLSRTTSPTHTNNTSTNVDPSGTAPGRPNPEPTSRKPKAQYRRFFKELADSEQMIDRETELAQQLTAGYQDLMVEIQLLKHLKDDLYKALEEAGFNGYGGTGGSGDGDGAPLYEEGLHKDGLHEDSVHENELLEDDQYDGDGGVSIEM